MTRVFSSARDWIEFRGVKSAGGSLGFVPTMGALHAGHLSLVERSLRENDQTLVSIFVNPSQFNDPKDLEKYPRPVESDLALLRKAGANFALTPEAAEIYPDAYRYSLHESAFSSVMEGVQRPGHFDGMLTVVLKLLNIARADRAYFGEKDRQQLELVRGMAEAFFLPTEIIGCPIVRDPRGLALSSRNARLNPSEMEKAPLFHKILSSSGTASALATELAAHGFKTEYIEEHGGFRYGAVKLGEVRLLDNVRATEETP